jgi:hypothetical protein
MNQVESKPCCINEIIIMKLLKVFLIPFAVIGLNLAVPLSALADDLDDIVEVYCVDVLDNVEDTLVGLDNAAQDLSRCDDKLDDCNAGILADGPAACFAEFGRCIADGLQDAGRECSEFTRELTRDTRQAQRAASNSGIGREFEQWVREAFVDDDSCLAPARETALLCSGDPSQQ